ncbi:MAG: hypothetical protein JWM47_2810 [Acidimicrobiales bacterium]|nr:hypothetical protein [Acidimicrobiales bacterium]
MGLWNLHQELAIQGLEREQRQAEVAADGRRDLMQQRLYAMEDRLERLLLLTDAMWELLSEKAAVSEAMLLAKVVEIDGRDGSVDGRRVRLARRCDQCGAAVEKGRATCMFCGHALAAPAAFDAV